MRRFSTFPSWPAPAPILPIRLGCRWRSPRCRPGGQAGDLLLDPRSHLRGLITNPARPRTSSNGQPNSTLARRVPQSARRDTMQRPHLRSRRGSLT